MNSRAIRRASRRASPTSWASVKPGTGLVGRHPEGDEAAVAAARAGGASRYDTRCWSRRRSTREIRCVLATDLSAAARRDPHASDFYDYREVRRREHRAAGARAALRDRVNRHIRDPRLPRASKARWAHRLDGALDGHLLPNELNSLPGFTEVPMYPRPGATGLLFAAARSADRAGDRSPRRAAPRRRSASSILKRGAPVASLDSQPSARSWFSSICRDGLPGLP
jgi:hypothetical protein